MRIIAGNLKGRIFHDPPGHHSHPMSEKARGALFNTLGDIEGLTVLDAMAGSGALAGKRVFIRSDLNVPQDHSPEGRGRITEDTRIRASLRCIELALGAGATFVARTLDTDKQHLPAMLRAAAAHPGAALIEIYQNCPVFNDGAFDALTDKRSRDASLVVLEHGQPIRFGADGERGVVRGPDGDLQVAAVAAVGEDALLVHDAHRADSSLAFALSRLADTAGGVTPIGIFRQAPRPGAAPSLAADLVSAQASFGRDGLAGLLHTADTWSVGA